MLWADGLAVGTPTNLGGISWRMKKFWDDWAADNWNKVDGKMCCTFSSQGGMSVARGRARRLWLTVRAARSRWRCRACMHSYEHCAHEFWFFGKSIMYCTCSRTDGPRNYGPSQPINSPLTPPSAQVFGVTDYVDKITTLHYGACVAKAPRNHTDKEACRILGLRLAECKLRLHPHASA